MRQGSAQILDQPSQLGGRFDVAAKQNESRRIRNLEKTSF